MSETNKLDITNDNDEKTSVDDYAVMNDPNGDSADMDNKIESNVGGQENTPDMDINEKSSKKNKKGQGKWIWGAILFLVLALVIGGFLGYRKGIARRMENQTQKEMEMIEAQLALYFGDVANGNYENAYARLDWIKTVKPNFPGIDDMIAEIIPKLAFVPTQSSPTITDGETQSPTESGEIPTPKPTIDLAQAEALYGAIQQAVADQNWHLAVEKILEIKEVAFDYKRILVDGYYFIALRNRGISRIWAGELEQGMYDLSVVDSLGALDSDANGAYQWAANYIVATTYWDVSWASAVEAFGVLYAQTPYFTEVGGMTVAERYRIALYKRGEEFAQQEDWCTAADYYRRSIEVGMHLDIQVTALAYEEYCNNPPGQSTPEPPVDTTPTPGGDTSPEPTEEPGPNPAP